MPFVKRTPDSGINNTEVTPPSVPAEPKKKGRWGVSYPNRLLKALSNILEDPEATVGERLQAARIALEALPLRKTPRRKTDKEKLVLEALKSKKKPRATDAPPAENDGKD